MVSYLLSLQFLFVLCCCNLLLCSSAAATARSTGDENDPKMKFGDDYNEDGNHNSNLYEDCQEVFIGGGWSGVYSMYRRVMEDPKNRASKACLFEQSNRIGGRTYSVSVKNDDYNDTNNSSSTPSSPSPFVIDIGAYRFSPDMHLPGDLILHDLQLPTECYQDTCPNAQDDFPVPFMFNYTSPLRRVVNPTTNLPAGYVTPISKMVEIVKDLGGRVFMETSLVEVDIIISTENEDNDDDDDDDDNDDQSREIMLKVEDLNTGNIGVIENPDVVMLNLPRNKLFEVKGVEETLSRPVTDTLQCIVFDTPSDLFGDLTFADDAKLLKAYMYFEDAFWHTALNETVGPWPLDNHFGAHPTTDGVMFNIRWHDGPVNCDSSSPSSSGNDGSRLQKCNGWLETYYSVSDEHFYSSLAPSPNEPFGSIWMSDGPEAVEKLMTAHAGLIDILMPLLAEKGIDDPDIIQPPQGLIVGSWHRPSEQFPLGQGYTAPTKVYYDPTMSGNPERACGVPGLTDETYREIALRPWGDDVPMFLANNDWVCGNVRYFFGDWAEESLLQAERAMLLLGSTKPEWLHEAYYQSKVVSMVEMSSSSQHLTVNTAGGGSVKINSQNNSSKYLTLSLVVLGSLLVVVITWKCYKKLTSQNRKDYTIIV